MTALYTPDLIRVEQSELTRFRKRVEQETGRPFASYADLHSWSVDDIPAFWSLLWDFLAIKASAPAEATVDDPTRMPGARWFPGARLNFAENLLRHANPSNEKAAILFRSEDRPARKLTYAQLESQVAAFQRGLRKMGIMPEDRIAALMPNMPETTIAMLAATASGAVWSSCSPDFGERGVLDRFGQIEPRVLVAADHYYFKGKRVDIRARIEAIAKQMPSVERIVLVSFDANESPSLADTRSVAWDDFCEAGSSEIVFEQLPFDHPVYIMYSSGTTGLPKCMVQGPGVLLNHLKELVLHTDLRENERIFYFTTCGWMMWNWLTSALAVGATIVQYDGNPFFPRPDALFSMADEWEIDVFGTSAKYLSALEDSGARPKERHSLKSMRAILSTGSPLAPESFDYVYRDIKANIQLSSITGGTDLNGCFALGNPNLPVHRGEIQCRGLGMAVEVFDDAGEALREKRGELVCTKAFPSMPLYFWDDPDGIRYRDAYFDVYPGIWRHGDFAEITRNEGLIVYGRSDATLNPGGVRIGTADIYNIVEVFPEIADSVVIGQSWKSDVRVILFVRLAKDGGTLTDDLVKRLRQAIREGASPRHVPAKVISVPDIPYTRNMKKVEIAVRRVVEAQAVTNREALANPEALDYFKDIPELALD